MSLGIGPHDPGCECPRCSSRRAASPVTTLELVKTLYSNLAVIIDQIDSCKPTEMIGAAFDGRELESARKLLRDYREFVYGKHL